MQLVTYGRIRAENYDIGTEQKDLIDFYLQQWRQNGSHTPVLEPMCGTGINLIPFIEAGADIDGLDASSYMLKICQQKLETLGMQASLYEQPLESMSLPRKYGFIMIPGGSFGHIHSKTQARNCLIKLYEHLQSDGELIIDVRPPSTRSQFPVSRQSEFDVEDQTDGSTIFTTSIWSDKEEGRVIRCWCKYERYIDNRLVETEIFDYHERFYDRVEFEAMLYEAGFSNVTQLDSWRQRNNNDGHTWSVFKCRKV